MTSTMTTTGWTVAVQGGEPVPAEVTVTQEVEYVRSYSAVLPDPKWRYTDSHGHEHRWAQTGRNRGSDALPSLVASERHVPCDGSCGGVCGGEGYHITVYHCTGCGDEVEPEFVPDYEARSHGIPFKGMRSMSAELSGWPFQGKSVAHNRWFPAVMVDPQGDEVRARVMVTEYRYEGNMKPGTVHVSLAVRPEVTADV